LTICWVRPLVGELERERVGQHPERGFRDGMYRESEARNVLGLDD
jgi:hypothetical protein